MERARSPLGFRAVGGPCRWLRATRTQDIKKRYPVIMDFGSGAGHLVKHLDQDVTKKVVMCDSASRSGQVSRSLIGYSTC